MKKKYTFTKDSLFIHVKDKMHMEVTEHIIKDKQTQKLYHHVVSYGSWFHISYSSIFMSHMLKSIGITGFGLAYSVDKCEVRLPFYPPYTQTRKSAVELPEGIRLQDVSFESLHKPFSEQFQKTFLGKTYEIDQKAGGVKRVEGKDLLKALFGCYAHKISEFKKGETSQPFYCILADMSPSDKEKLKIRLEGLDLCACTEIRTLLQKYVEFDVAKELKILEEEAQVDMSELCKELLARQAIISDYLAKEMMALDEEKEI